MDELLAVCSREPGNELVAAECGHLVGGRVDAYGVAHGRTLAHIHRAAYARTGVRCLARARTLDGLVTRISHLSLDAADFRIEFLRLSEQARVGKRRAIVAVANAIDAAPNLDEPAHRFLLAAQDDGLWFGEIVAQADRSYARHDAKPYRTSCSLPSRLARALVNLVSPPAGTILNPCCGTGSILLEAWAIGDKAYGLDWNPGMVDMSRHNLAHFGYPATVELGDARDWRRTGDALIADLPYGLFWHTKKEIILGLLKASARLAPIAVVVAVKDISHWLREAGYDRIQVLRVCKNAGFTRYVHLAHSPSFPAPVG